MARVLTCVLWVCGTGVTLCPMGVWHGVKLCPMGCGTGVTLCPLGVWHGYITVSYGCVARVLTCVPWGVWHGCITVPWGGGTGVNLCPMCGTGVNLCPLGGGVAWVLHCVLCVARVLTCVPWGGVWHGCITLSPGGCGTCV